jgi:hypothetical protein
LYPKLRAFILFSILSLFFSSCSDSPGPVGYSILNPDDLIYLKQVSSDSLSQTSSCLIHQGNQSALTRVLLGKFDNAEASFLTKFYFGSLNDSILSYIKDGNIVIRSAKVEMTSVYKLGDAGNQFDYSVHKINSGWTAANFNTDSLSILNYDGSDISSGREISNDSIYSFNINTDVVMQWLKAVADTNSGNKNYGILLKPSASTNRVLGFQATTGSSTEQIISIKVDLHKEGWYDTVFSFSSISSIHAIQGTLPAANPDYIYVQGGLPINSKLKFDLPKFPNNTVINDAKLVIQYEPTKSNLGDPGANYLYVLFLTDSSKISYDSSSTAYLTKDGNTFTGDISRYVQKWIMGVKNYGVVISLLGQIETLDLLAIPGSTNSDKSKRPSLTIKYTTKK